MTKSIDFSKHALDQMKERGASESEVIDTIRSGEKVPAKQGRQGYRKNFQYNQVWGGKQYATKQVMAIIVDEPNAIVVITVFTFYF